MAILGESFKPYVKNQIDVRQEKLALGNRDDDTLKYITSKTSFLRLSSGVDISSAVAQNLGVIGFEGNMLAKQYVLFSSNFDNQFTSGIGYSLGSFNASYGFNSDPNFGLVPPPGLTMATINTLNRGTIREATINLVCHNLYQFKIINALFLKLKYSLLLEWGHTLYFNNDKSLATPIDIPNLSTDFLKGEMSSDQILNQIEIERSGSFGNYDAFFGVVKNFNWELQENGSYNIMVNAISQGDVIESLKVNSNLNPNIVTTEKIDGVDENMYKKSTLHYILGWIIRKLKDSGTLNGFKDTDVSNALNTDTLASITKLKAGYKESDDTGVAEAVSNSLTYREGITVTFSELGKVYDQTTGASSALPQYYIKLGTLLRIVEAFLLYYDTSKNKNGSSPSIFYIDHSFEDGKNECITAPRQVSADPLTCLIPFSYVDSTQSEGKVNITYFFDITTKTYQIDINENGEVINIALTNTETQTDVKDEPVGVGGEVVTDSQDGYGNPLSAITPLETKYDNAIRLIKLNAKLLTGQSLTLTTRDYKRRAEAAITDATQAGTLSNLDDSFRNIGDPYIGNTMHIYVNINKIIEVLDNNIDGNGNVTIYSFLTQLLGEISRAMCSINKFDIDYDEATNSFSIIDTAVFPLKYKNVNNVAKFNINLLKDKTNGGGSFVTNFGLKSEVFGQISNAIALGSQANGNTMQSNSTPISSFNTGLTDRIIQDKQNPNTIISPSGSWIDNNYDTLVKYEQFKLQIANGTIQEYDIDLYRSFLVDLLNFDLGYYTENAQIPGTGFIPLNLQLTMDGLSGIRQYQTFDIDETLLPNEYYDKLKFITTTVTHKIDTKGWETTINSLGVPKNNKDPKPVDQNIPKVEVKKETKKTVDISEKTTATSGGAYKIRNQGAYKTQYWKMGVHHSKDVVNIVSTPGGDWSVGYKKSNYIGFFTKASNYKTIDTKNSNKEYAVFDFTLFRNDSSDVDIPAPFDGKVVAQGTDSKGNTYMALLSTDGVKTAVILHMRAVYKKKGDTFVKGEKIAIQASVGPSSTGVHTHVELMAVGDFEEWWDLIIGLPDSYAGLSTLEPINVA
jgi:hypothetical protein